MHIAKSVLQYLKKIISFKLIYKRDIIYLIKSYKSHNIIGYLNSNYVNNSKD